MAAGKYTGIYRGIVITDIPDSVENMFKVQVYVSDIDTPADIFDKSVGYIFPGTGTLNTNFLSSLRSTCPWYSVVTPVSGGGSMGRLFETDDPKYSKYNGYVTVSDTGVSEEIARNDKTFGYAKNGTQNVTLAPHYANGSVSGKVHAGNYSSPNSNMLRNGNLTDNEFTANVNYYANAPKGEYHTPKLGSFVIVAYLDGLKENGYIIGKAPAAREWQLVHCL